MIRVCILLATIVVLTILFRVSPAFTACYSRFVFVPVQSLRGFLSIHFSLSIGDVLYVAAGVLLVISIIRWMMYLLNWRTANRRLVISAVTAVNSILIGYLWFLVGWGGNYYKQPLRQVWQLDQVADTLQLETFDSILVTRLNVLAPMSGMVPQRDLQIMAVQNYHLAFNVKVAGEAIHIKYSAFSYFLQRMAIEGYYNPFTGEGQISDRLPGFMQPFVIDHEMAHQLGIASESDANLAAYAAGSVSPYPVYRYSASLNLWLYVDARLSRRDSVAAQKWEARLNSITKAHLDTLEKLAELYDNNASRYGAQLYDGYLKMQQQKDGIRSYGGVTADAWRLELMRNRNLIQGKLPLP